MQNSIQYKIPEFMSVKLNYNCLKVSTILIFMLFFQVANAQYDFKIIDKKLEDAKKELGGDAIAMVYKDGKVIYQKALGEFTSKIQAPIASTSKWLTAALVMTYVDQGKLSLEDKVSTYLPIFSKYSKGYITIRQCLSHLTGIESDPIRQSDFSSKRKYASLEEEVNEFASKREIQSNPGLEFRYSNIGFNIAGRVLEVITRRSFEQLMQEKITRPLMMRNTNFSSFSAVNPSGGGVSSGGDLLNFLSMMLNKGMFNGKRILSEKAIADMQTAQTTPDLIKYVPEVMVGSNYGLGEWILRTDTKGEATIVACPGLYGCWAQIDYCRGMAFVFLTKSLEKEEKVKVYPDIISALESLIPCK